MGRESWEMAQMLLLSAIRTGFPGRVVFFAHVILKLRIVVNGVLSVHRVQYDLRTQEIRGVSGNLHTQRISQKNRQDSPIGFY